MPEEFRMVEMILLPVVVSISISGTTGGSSPSTNSQTVSISGNTGSKGSGNSHENRPPYYALCYIMKT